MTGESTPAATPVTSVLEQTFLKRAQRLNLPPRPPALVQWYIDNSGLTPVAQVRKLPVQKDSAATARPLTGQRRPLARFGS